MAVADPVTPSGDESDRLPRVFGGVTAVCVIVGSVIGSGIFLVPSEIARELPYTGAIIAAWILGGVFSLAGALTLAEPAAMLPRAGGPYVYLREAYGSFPAFLFGWTEFLVIRTGSMAALAAAFAKYFAQLVPPPPWVRIEIWQAGVAIAAIATLGFVNVRGAKLGGGVQAAGTAIKLSALGAMIVLPFLLGRAKLANLEPIRPEVGDSFPWAGFFAAMVAVLWAYDGWVNLTPLAEEVKDPGKNVPRALILGCVILIVVYVSMAIAYHLALSLPELAGDPAAAPESRPPAAAVYCSTLLGRFGATAAALVVMTSTFIALNGNALTGPRAYFAMSRDGVFFAALGAIHSRRKTPAAAIIAQCAWACALTLAATALLVAPAPPRSGARTPMFIEIWRTAHDKPLYDIMFTYVIFGATLFYALAAASVFVLRLRRPELRRPYRVWGYPLTPAFYLAGAGILLANMLQKSRAESFTGLAIIACGIPAFWYFSSKKRARANDLAAGARTGDAAPR